MPINAASGRALRVLVVAVAAAWCAGCAASPQARLARAEAIGASGALRRVEVPAGEFRLTVFARLDRPGPLRVYIEGDGYAWATPRRASPDPTPARPLALELAARDPAANVVYLARPCQFTHSDPRCSQRHWTNERYSEEIVRSMDAAVDRFARAAEASAVDLVGYSGGAAIAVLLAARRPDVRSLRTVAGNLDPHGLTRRMGASPLNGSLDPLGAAAKLKRLPQRHFVGEDDDMVTRAIAEEFLAAAPTQCSKITTVAQVGHAGGWKERWLDLLAVPLPCE